MTRRERYLGKVYRGVLTPSERASLSRMEQDAEADLQSERLGDYREVDYPYKREKSVMMAYWESRLALLEMKKYGVHALMRGVYAPPPSFDSDL